MGRTQVQQIFLDFLDEDADSWRRSRDGLYVSYLFGKNDEKVKVVLLYSSSCVKFITWYLLSWFFLMFVLTLIEPLEMFLAMISGHGLRERSLVMMELL